MRVRPSSFTAPPRAAVRSALGVLALAFLVASSGASAGARRTRLRPVRPAPALSEEDDIHAGIDWLARPDNCGAPSRFGCKWETYSWPPPCQKIDLGSWSHPWIYRANRSANECAAWAVHYALKGDKYQAAAWLEIAFCHDPNARSEFQRHKKEALRYLLDNYVAGWKNDDPEVHTDDGQVFKVGSEYDNDALDGCVGDGEMSLLEVPPGLRVRVSTDDHGNGPSAEVGPGVHGLYEFAVPGTPFNFNDNVHYVRVFRAP